MKIFNKFLIFLNLSILIVASTFFIHNSQFIIQKVMAWTNPTQNPPPTGTAGGVLYFSGTNVGIGTAAPGAKLDVSAASALGINTNGWSIATGGFYVDSGTQAGINTNSASGLAFRAGLSDSRMVILAGGNVGIGKTNPSTALDVNGTVTALNFTGPLTGTNYATNVAAGQFGANVGGGNYSFPANVGIGTSTPGNLLAIYGSSAGSRGIFIDNTNTAGYAVLRMNSGSVDAAVGMAIHDFGSTWTDSGNGSARRPSQTNLASWESNGIAISAENVAGVIDFLTAGSATTSNRMRINSLGNVGIGTTAPNYKLEVAGGGSGSVYNVASFQNSTALAGQGTSIFLSNGGGQNYAVKLAAINQTSNPDYLRPRLGIFVQDTNTYLPSGLKEVVSVLAESGNVGIGTTAPITKLDVNGVVGVFDSGTKSRNGGIASEVSATLINFGLNEDYTNRFGGSYTSADQGGMVRVDTRAGQPLFSFLGRAAGSVSGTSNLMSITSAGNVGIGIAAPDAKLAITSTGAGTAGLVVHGASGDTWFPYTDGKNYIRGTTIIADLGGVNVGIGTSTPGQKLEVTGNIYANNGGSSSYIMANRLNNTTTDAYSYYYTGGASKWLAGMGITGGVSGQDTYNLVYYNGTSWLNRLIIDTSGNVGIGMTAPGTRLDVGASTADTIRSYGGFTGNATANIAGTGAAAYFPSGLYANGANEWLYGTVTMNGVLGGFTSISTINGYSPANGAVRLTPNLHLNSTAGYAVIVNWDSGAVASTVQQFRVGNGSAADAFYVTAGGSVYGGAFYYTSDRRLKEDIRRIENPIEKILKLEGVSYKWKKSGENDIGLIAQDVEKVFPEVVNTSKETGLKSIDYGHLIGVLVEGVKTQQTQIDNLEKRLEKLEK